MGQLEGHWICRGDLDEENTYLATKQDIEDEDEQTLRIREYMLIQDTSYFPPGSCIAAGLTCRMLRMRKIQPRAVEELMTERNPKTHVLINKGRMMMEATRSSLQ